MRLQSRYPNSQHCEIKWMQPRLYQECGRLGLISRCTVLTAWVQIWVEIEEENAKGGKEEEEEEAEEEEEGKE
eukprot:3607049-Rhodomonas_salina.3